MWKLLKCDQELKDELEKMMTKDPATRNDFANDIVDDANVDDGI